MNRIVVIAASATAAAGLALWRKYQADKAEQDLWAEVTDAVD